MDPDSKHKISVLLRGFRPLTRDSDPAMFFEQLERHNLFPDKIESVGQAKMPHTLEAASRLWRESPGKNELGVGYVDFWGRKHAFRGSATWLSDTSNRVSLWLSPESIPDIRQLVDFVKWCFGWMNGVYGYGFHSSQRALHNMPGMSYTTCLGGISWMAVFGEPYVKMFGEDVLASAPCIVEEFGEHNYLLLTSETPCIPNEEILERQQKVKEHLGTDAFYRHDHVYKKWAWEEIIAGKDRPNTEGYRSPDFSRNFITPEKEGRVIFFATDEKDH